MEFARRNFVVPNLGGNVDFGLWDFVNFGNVHLFFPFSAAVGSAPCFGHGLP